jgi:methionyl aminopeptidase
MIKLKSVNEINGIRESCKFLAETHKELAKLVEIGISTNELDKFARNYIEQRGGIPAFLGYMDYPASLCTSINEVVIHGIPTDRKLIDGDIISLDLGINYKGFFSDAAVTLPVGNISEEAAKLIRITKESLFRGIEKAVMGNRIHDVSRAVYNHAKSENYGVVRDFCGHGVGFSPHEAPQVPNYVGSGANPRIKKGMVLAIEPMINLGVDEVRVLDDDWTVLTMDKKISAHWEHTVAVFEDHTEILTILR